MKFSVIVCSYNSNEKKIKNTLNSIVSQSLDDFEIIVCDDGSKNNHEVFLKNYFKERNFSNYKLILNMENQGTVKNILSGLFHAKGEYIKPIGVGDILSDQFVLEHVYQCMKFKKIKCLFGKMNIFSINNGQKKIYKNMSIPVSCFQYINEPYKDKMKENIIVFNDQISGASMFYETQYFKRLLEIMKEYVIYMEDLVQYLILLSEERIYYLNEYCVDYEIGTGLSTFKSKENNIRMKTDKNNFLNYIFENYSMDSCVTRRKKIEDIERKYNNKLVKGFLKLCTEPKWIMFRITRR